MNVNESVFVVRVKEEILGVFDTLDDAYSARNGLIMNGVEQEHNILLEEVERNVCRPWIRFRLP